MVDEVVGRRSWVVRRGSWVMGGRRSSVVDEVVSGWSSVVGRGSWVVGRGTWVVGRGRWSSMVDEVVGRRWSVVRCGWWVVGCRRSSVVDEVRRLSVVGRRSTDVGRGSWLVARVGGGWSWVVVVVGRGLTRENQPRYPRFFRLFLTVFALGRAGQHLATRGARSS